MQVVRIDEPIPIAADANQPPPGSDAPMPLADNAPTPPPGGRSPPGLTSVPPEAPAQPPPGPELIPPAETPPVSPEIIPPGALTPEYEAAAKTELERQKGEEAKARLDQRTAEEAEVARQNAVYDAAKAKAQARLDDLDKKTADFKFHDLHRGVASTILGAIASFLGGASATEYGGQNYALKRLEDTEAADYERQKQELLGVEKQREYAKQGIVGLDQQHQAAMVELNHLTARKFDSIADKFEMLSATTRGKLQEAAGMQQAQEWRDKAAKLDEQAKKDAAELGLKQAQTDEQKSLAKLHDVQAAAGGFAPKKGAKGGSGGGGGSGDAMSKFIEAANGLAPGDQIPPSIAKLAAAAHIKPNQIAAEVDKYRGSGGKAEKAGGQLERQLGNDVQRAIQADKESTSRIKELSELERAKAELASGNPLRYGAALDAFTKSATGLGARPASVKLFETRLGGTIEQIKARINAAVEGNPFSEAELKRFRDAVAGEIAAAKADLKSSRGRLEKSYAEHPQYKTRPELVKSVLDRTYGSSGPTPVQLDALAAVPAGDPRYQRAQAVLKANGR